ncbi:MAG: CotH kinase family protein [Crocinitomicaceae bacterium]
MLKKILKIARYLILILVFLAIIPAVFIAYKIKNDYPLREYIKTNYFTSIPDDINTYLTPVNKDSVSYLIKRIELIVSDESIDSLKNQIESRLQSINNGNDFILGTSHWTYVPGKLIFKDDTMSVKLRIRGDFPTNYNRDISESTFRIDIKGGQFLNGKRKISLIRPELENNLFGFLYYKCFESEGLIANDIDFVNLTFNGKIVGIRFLQEGFSNELTESSGLDEGPILRFKNDCIDNIGRYNPGQFPEMIAYKEKRILKDKDLSAKYALALSVYQALADGEIRVEQGFNIDTYAKFMALSDIFLSHHAYKCQNVKVYFNPKTDKFEPIAWDPSSYVRYNVKLPVFPGHNKWFGGYHDNPTEYPLHFLLAQSRSFQSKYVSYLQDYSKIGKIDTMLSQFLPAISVLKPVLFQQNFQQGFDINFYKENCQNIRHEFLKDNHIRASAFISESTLEVRSNQMLPILIDSIKYLTRTFEYDTILLPGTKIDLPFPVGISLKVKDKIRIYSTILNTSNSSSYSAKVFYRKSDFRKEHFIEKYKNQLPKLN